MKYIILGHPNPDVDSIFSGILLERLSNKVANSDKYKYMIPDDNIDGITLEIVKKFGIDIREYQSKDIGIDDEIILVDHYEDNRYSNKIKAIFDHHPVTTDFKDKPEVYYNLNSCSTTMVLAKIFDKILTKEDLILVLVAALVDTVSFNSTKTNFEEVKYLKKRCEDFSIYINDYYEIGLCLNSLEDLKKTSLYGLKKYKIHGKKVVSSYIQIKNVSDNDDKINEMLLNIRAYMIENNIDIFLFLVNDMDFFKTKTYEFFGDNIEITEYDKCISRGSTAIPILEKKIVSKYL